MSKLCETCTATRDDPHVWFPTHLVHPEHHKPGVWSVNGDRTCGALWRSKRNNTVELVTA